MTKIKMTMSTMLLLGVVGGNGILAAFGFDRAWVADKAAEIISQARQALGGDDKVRSIQTLSASGKYHRKVGEMELAGEIQLEFMLPDKFRQMTTMEPVSGGPEITNITVLNGDKQWTDIDSGGAGNVVIRRPGGDSPEAKARQLKGARADFARYLIGWLLVSPGAVPVEFSYAGEAETEKGRADILDATSPDGFAARIFVDQASHLPMLMSYKGVAGGMRIQTMTADGMSPGDLERKRKEAERSADQMPAPAVDQSEINVVFSDYQAEAGIMLPHKITRTSGGKIFEETELAKFKINPPIKSQRFEKK